MPWFHVDDRFASHPKVLATSLEARGLWVTAGSWSSAHLTDGVVPDQVLAALGGTPELAAELVTAGLWKRRRAAHAFHDWTGNGNPSKEAVEKERAAAAERQRRSRAARASRRDSQGDSRVTSAAHTSSSYRTTTGRARGPASAARSPGQAKPPWCGDCDEASRQIDIDGLVARCPACHPLAPSQEAS